MPRVPVLATSPLEVFALRLQPESSQTSKAVHMQVTVLGHVTSEKCKNILAALACRSATQRTQLPLN